MRITQPEQVRLSLEDDSADLIFRGSRQEKFRIDVLDHDLIRVRHHPDGKARLDRTWLVVGTDGEMPLEGRSRDDLSPFPMPKCWIEVSNNHAQIHTEQLHLRISLGDFRIEWFDKDERRFAADLRLRGYPYDRDNGAVYHYLERRTDEHYYGLGERAGDLDKYGQRFRMINVDALGYSAKTSDPLYKHFPFYITYIPSLKIAYGLFYDNLSTTTFDLGCENDAFWGYYRYYMAEAGDIDYTLIYGPTMEAVVEKFTKLTGRPCLPPRWSLGYLGSTMKYTEAPDAQEQLKRFVDLCEEHDIPCDMFHLSSGYGTDAQGTRYVFTWNHSRVPDPKAMTAHFHAAGIKVAANIKPHLLKNHPEFEQLAASGGLIKAAESDAPALTRFWSGGAFEHGEGGYVDFTSAAGYQWWKDQLKSALLDFGVDAAWNDNNEFEIWDDAARCAGYGEEIPLALARPLQTLQMARASYEATLEHKPDERPFVLSRSGCPGIQRYAQTWSGDNTTSWETLRYNIPMGLGLSLSGMPNTGHDIGGFHGPAPDPELFVRWVQNGVFQPRFAIHSWNTDGTVNEPWMYPDVLPIVRAWIEMRYQLRPYLYSLFWEAHTTGHPIIRPMVYEFPDDPRCWTESFDFMLGSHLLVASVLEPGVTKRKVYLPMGTWWCDFIHLEWYEGGQEVEVDAPLDQMPIFVRDGGIIPMEDGDQRVARVFARETAEFTLIEDDGISLDYQHGGYTSIRLSVDVDGGCKAERILKGFELPYTQMRYVLPDKDVDVAVT
ncbi:MAG TPA: glycoside hydrolase family 31 protein [Phototrophicaceae bacterium]|nr:glycoside hydrolase family 31 protein [Phototrophicaceae bacterium]